MGKSIKTEGGPNGKAETGAHFTVSSSKEAGGQGQLEKQRDEV